jgi:CobQ-like glutamine amidotransferase family enzyme
MHFGWIRSTHTIPLSQFISLQDDTGTSLHVALVPFAVCNTMQVLSGAQSMSSQLEGLRLISIVTQTASTWRMLQSGLSLGQFFFTFSTHI